MHHLDAELIENWQRAFPVVERPFQVLAEACGVCEDDVISRLRTLREAGVVARVAATGEPIKSADTEWVGLSRARACVADCTRVP